MSEQELLLKITLCTVQQSNFWSYTDRYMTLKGFLERNKTFLETFGYKVHTTGFSWLQIDPRLGQVGWRMVRKNKRFYTCEEVFL